jgi:hypothetical protein
MTYSESFGYSGSYDTLYAKPCDEDSVPNTLPWDESGIVEEFARGGGSVVFRGLADGQRYLIYAQKKIGGPESADAPALGEIRDSRDLAILAQLAAIESSTTDISRRAAFGFTVIPSVRSNGSKVDISTFVGEQQSPSIPLTIDLTDDELEVVWEPATERNLTEIAVLTTEDLNVTETTIQFRLPFEVYSKVRQLKYSLRRVVETSESSEPDKVVIFQGTWTIMSTSLKR